jgi:hypothetical protein
MSKNARGPGPGTRAIVSAFCRPLLLVLCVLVLSLLIKADTAAQRLPLTNSRDLLAATSDDLTTLLESARPLSVSDGQRARVLDSLPDEGEVTSLDAASRQKLRALTPLLRAAKREAVYVLKVVAVPQAFIGLHARTILLISHPALTLLSPDELQGVVAHEIGHEYVWADYERVSRLADDAQLQDLELVCDLLGILTLRRIGQDGARLVTGMEKLIGFNRERFGAAANEGRYPTLARRRAVAQALEAGLASGHRAAVTHAPPY